MNFFNEIDKISYKKETKDPIQLIEYIKFKDEKTEEKFLLFKFRNNLNQIVSSMKVEIKQYDNENSLIEKTVFSYDNFKASAQEIFVPTAKLKVNYKTEYIEARLLQANFESVWWNGETLLPIYYSEEEFSNTYADSQNKKSTKVKRFNEGDKPSYGKNVTKYKDVTKSNKPKFPKILTLLLSIAILAASVYTIFRLRTESKYVHDEYFEYEILNKEEIKIINYFGNNIDLTIPDKFKKFSITAIEKNAFKDADIRTLTFKKGNIKISANAFEDCKMLTQIKDEAGVVSYVGLNAFEDCENLKTVILPNAVVANEAFLNCDKITTLNINSIVNTSLYNVFNNLETNNEIRLNSLEIKQESITNSFFTQISSIHTIILSGSTHVSADALENMNINTLSISKDAVVAPECLVTFVYLNVKLNSDNKYKKEDYLIVNPNLTITNWFNISE